MSKILILDKDIYLTYSWSSINHGICGHTFEVLDYFWILKDQFDIGILLCEDINWDIFEKAIKSKYNFNDTEISIIKSNTVFKNRPSLIKGKNIIFVDGGTRALDTKTTTLLFENIIMFACGDKDIKNITKENVYVLQDNRVYDIGPRTQHYIKKILFNRLIKPKNTKNNILLYATKNCRALTPEYLKNLSDNLPCDNILCLVNEIPEDKYTNIRFSLLPYNNLIEDFNTYIYTPVARKFDCSPRFIAECHYFNKQVIYDVDYWLEDKGLFWRAWDIDNNFNSIQLGTNDEIIKIIRKICEI